MEPSALLGARVKIAATPTRVAICTTLLAGSLFFAGWSSAAETRALVVAGLGGDAAYEEQFRDLTRVMADSLGVVAPHVVLLQGQSSNKNQVRTTLEAFASQSTGEDYLLFCFVGHGTFDGKVFRFNVPGRDFSAGELGEWLDGVNAGRQLVIVTGSASGALHDIIGGENRTLMTATRSGNEKNATVFPRFLVAALGNPTADLDKDDLVSADEAWRYAEAQVASHYKQARQLLSEHPRRSGPPSGLILGAVSQVEPIGPYDVPDPLLARQGELADEVAELRQRKKLMEPGDYFAELQRLLLEMGMLEQQIEDGKRNFDEVFSDPAPLDPF